MKITLIRPPYVVPLKSVYGNNGVPSLGLAYLSAALKSEGHDVECLDTFAESMDQFLPIEGTDLLINGLSQEQTLARISDDSVLIGVSCMFSNEWINTSQLILAIKAKFPNAHIVLGGEHVTADYKYILENYSAVDFCILGEGEEKIKSLARALKQGDIPLDKIEGISFFDKIKNEVITNSSAYRIADINNIAEPDWDSLSIRRFLDRGMGMSIQGKRTIPMLLSRGCPYRCTFCSSEAMWTTKWTSRSIECVIAEIKKYIYLYRINHVDFYDLTAVINKKWTIQFCQTLLSENLGITWSLPSGTRSEALDLEVLHLLKTSGCIKITYAPESGSPVMSKLIKKNVKLDRMLESMRFAVKEGLIVKANIIFGFPDERLRDWIWNFWYIFKMAFVGIHDVPCFRFTPYPGSALFERLLNEGKIKRDNNYYYFLARLVYTSPLDKITWNKFPGQCFPILSLGGMAFFYSLQYTFRPWRLLHLFRNILRRSPVTMLDAGLCNIIDDFWHGKKLIKLKNHPSP